jgi:hypothetical protein
MIAANGMALAQEKKCTLARGSNWPWRNKQQSRGRKMSPKTKHGAARRNEWQGKNIRPRLLPMVI